MNITNEKVAKLISEIERVSKRTPREISEDFNPADNYDDTFYAGEEYGRIDFAQELLKILD